MKFIPLAIILAFIMFSLSTGVTETLDAEHLRVLYRKHDDACSVWTRFSFSSNQDLVLNFARKQQENGLFNSYETRLVPRTAPFREQIISEGELVHSNGDDATPWHINGTYIGGNHGCLALIQMTDTNKVVTIADIGSSWRDEAGTTFYIVDLPAPGVLQLLSENMATYPFWQFQTQITGKVLKRTDGASLPVDGARLTQIWPCARIKEQKVLANGTELLKADQTSTCSFLDLVEDYDIINPASLLAQVIAHPGRRPNFVDPGLDAVINNRIIYRISSNASVTIFHEATSLQSFNLDFMGFVQQAILQKPSNLSDQIRYYIPKLDPFHQDGVSYDFASLQTFDTLPNSPLRLSASDTYESRNLPDRFIQFLGSPGMPKNKNRLGFAFGYSPIRGMTTDSPHVWDRKDAGFIHTTGKTYPFAIDKTVSNPIKAGETFSCTAYRQYFNPESQQNATCVFWHSVGDRKVVFIDYHKAVSNDLIRLPRAFCGRNFKILEKTESISTLGLQTISPDGLRLSCDRDYGYLVIEVN